MQRVRGPFARSKGGVLALALGALVVAYPAAAQTTGELQGVAADHTGGALPGVTLEARSPALQGVRLTVSDAGGRYRFPLLPPGSYRVTARLEGFEQTGAMEVRVGLGENATLPITLRLSKSTELVVSGAAPLIETSQTRLGTVTSAETFTKLPLGRSYASIATTVGGVGRDAQGLTVYGATGLENQYLIDGVNTTGIYTGNQGKQLNAEFIQEVEVRTGGYEAEYGQVFGGNINVITRSGGNEFQGDVFGYYDSGALAAGDEHEGDRNAVNQSQLVLPRRLDAGADLGGFFVKDRLWFFGAYDRVNSDEDYRRVESLTYTDTAVVSNLKSGVDETHTDLFSGKLTLRAGEGHTLALSAFGDPTRFSGRQAANRRGPDSATLVDIERGGTALSLKWDAIFGSSFVVQSQYGFDGQRTHQSSAFADSLSIAQIRRGQTQWLPGSGPPGLVQDTFRRHQLRVAGSAFLGRHELKAGLGYEYLDSDAGDRIPAGEQIFQTLRSNGALRWVAHYAYATRPFNCTALADGREGSFGFVDPNQCLRWETVGASYFDARGRNLALFAQDSIRLTDHLTLNLGLRYETQRIDNAAGDAGISLKDQWSPRLGAVWDPLENGRSKVFASYGRYYQAIPQLLQVAVLGDEGVAVAYNLTANRPDMLHDPEVFPFEYPTLFGSDYVPPGIKGTYQDEIVAGVEYEVATGWSVGLKGIYRALGRAIEDRCDVFDPRAGILDKVPQPILNTCVVINPGEGELGQIRDPGNPDCFEDYPENTVPAPCESVKARRTFRGLQLDVRRRVSNGFYVQASYLYSKLVGNYDGFVNQDTGQASPGLDASFDYVDTQKNSFGRLGLDRRHQLKLAATYALPFGLEAGVSARADSGRPLSILGRSPVSGYPVYLVPRGEYAETSWTYGVDLHLEYRLALGPFSVSPILDVFNVTNTQRATARFPFYVASASDDQSPPFTNPTDPRFNRGTAWQAPRLVRVGARVSF